MSIALINRLAGDLALLIGDRPVALLDWPDYANAGDHFIWLGEKILLRRIGATVIFEAPSRNLNFDALARLPGDCVFICHGGGNFGDLYPRHQSFREQLVDRFPDRRIVMMPQSVNYRNAERFEAMAEIFGRHLDLHVMARDTVSWERLQGLPGGVRRYLHTDSAFALQPIVDALVDALGPPAVRRRRPLRLMRRDEERSTSAPRFADAIDWSVTDDLAALAALAPPPSAYRLASRAFTSPLDLRSWRRLWAAVKTFHGATFLVTDRLHAHILARMMRLPHRVVGDSHGKISAFVETWGGVNLARDDRARLNYQRHASILLGGKSSEGNAMSIPNTKTFEPEPIRLVVWDLDETFWRGTLVEGGIREYVQAHHDAVIELARRGIVSSICSKNDHETVESLLRQRGLWEYFVFPSIEWSAKGPRLRALVDKIGLRAPTILFIDDNHGNRAEAAAAVPGLQVADESIIGTLLRSPLCVGKEDHGLTRLAQYRLLEQRSRDQDRAGGDNLEFLRASNIRVAFEYDVEQHIERAIELINRTNQLNYTKIRLPQKIDEARAALRDQIKVFYRQAALIRVVDNYGDYGFCGFYLRNNGQGGGAGSLFHYCFSCRTLGMGVEQWVYDYIGRPSLKISGDVISELPANRVIDWIRLSDASGAAASDKWLPEVRLRGGCEIDALSHYFVGITDTCRREASATRGPFFVSKNCSHHIVTPSKTTPTDEFIRVAEACGFEFSDFTTELFSPCEPGALFVFSGWNDIKKAYRHRKSKHLLTVVLPGLWDDVTKMDNADVDAILSKRNLRLNDQDKVRAAVASLRANCDFVGSPSEKEIKLNLSRLFSSLPTGIKAAALAVDEFWKDKDGSQSRRWVAVSYNAWLRQVAEQFGVRVFQIGDFVLNDSEREFTDHFDRIVYYRLASAIIEWVQRDEPHLPSAMRS